jgi:molybdenum cofactor synthesis domain-containing protein
VTVSDRSARGEREDASGARLAELVADADHLVIHREVVPDDPEALAHLLRRLAQDLGADLVLTTGGTGIGPRDRTPEATAAACDRLVPGIAEAIRAASLATTPYAMLSRAVAGVLGTTLVVNLPGSPGGAAGGWSVVAPVVAHACAQLRGGDHPV